MQDSPDGREKERDKPTSLAFGLRNIYFKCVT